MWQLPTLLGLISSQSVRSSALVEFKSACPTDWHERMYGDNNERIDSDMDYMIDCIQHFLQTDSIKGKNVPTSAYQEHPSAGAVLQLLVQTKLFYFSSKVGESVCYCMRWFGRDATRCSVAAVSKTKRQALA